MVGMVIDLLNKKKINKSIEPNIYEVYVKAFGVS